MTGFDACVVGLGAVGSQITHALRRRGLSVLGLDRYEPPHEFGSSGGRTRMIREAYFEDPLYVPFVQRAYELWDALERDSGDRLLTHTGGVMIGPPNGELVAGALRSARQHDLPYEELTCDEVRRRFPVLQVGGEHVGVFEPRAGVLDATKCIKAALNSATRSGADLHFAEPAISWHASNEGLVVRTELDTYSSEALIVAAGAWANELLRETLPLNVARQPLLWFRPRARPELFEMGVLPVFIWELQPGLIYYGFPTDREGFKVARHHRGALTTPDALNRQLTPDDESTVRQFLEQAIPDANGILSASKVCMYTNTPDHHFLIDRLPEHERVFIVSPCSGHGFKFASAIGEAVAELVADGRSHLDLGPFGLNRFVR
jgi:sarcosine oxidase